MYYILHNGFAYGLFLSRDAAYAYAAKHDWPSDRFAVKSDSAMQQNYLHWPIHKPE